jgi:PPOX class probable F420-dependent enzyme
MPATKLELPGQISDFLARPLHAVVGTTNPDGSAHQAVVWYMVEEDGSVLVNSAEGRRWPANLERDPRISLVVVEGGDFVALKGSVTVDEDQDRTHEDINRLARRYEGDDETKLEERRQAFEEHVRITFRFVPNGYYTSLEE